MFKVLTELKVPETPKMSLRSFTEDWINLLSQVANKAPLHWSFRSQCNVPLSIESWGRNKSGVEEKENQRAGKGGVERQTRCVFCLDLN